MIRPILIVITTLISIIFALNPDVLKPFVYHLELYHLEL